MESEKEKMLAGKPYFAMGKELSEERLKAKELLFDFNHTHPKEIKQRNTILKELLGGTKKSFYFEPPFRCDYGYNIFVGSNFYSNYNLIILDCAKVRIGDNVMMAPNVSIFTAGHPVHQEPRNKFIEYAIPVTIGNGVWIGGHTVINPGVNIGDNAVIGSGSVVTKDIPANVIAFGNPCKVVREITEEDKDYYFRKLKF
ncbi:sugar O-acetyltransferase [Gramella sp. AN32]|uniref:Acetyltransferase n=1 Tax=Christiangramia antarctica TaxID=2058158 RepID=A0ABW5XAU1_9FLAO|nr:sugar O-acetyltransferase [Gramella sp. AN32]MCM4155264.1 maltose O-acetyltransferase [Gramella sp. AN32]